jgi:hypothetical protein
MWPKAINICSICNGSNTLNTLSVRHNITANVSGVPGGFARHYATQDLAQGAYNEALDGGEVTHITYIVSKQVLSH